MLTNRQIYLYIVVLLQTTTERAEMKLSKNLQAYLAINLVTLLLLLAHIAGVTYVDDLVRNAGKESWYGPTCEKVCEVSIQGSLVRWGYFFISVILLVTTYFKGFNFILEYFKKSET